MNPKMAHRSEQNPAFFKKLNSYKVSILINRFSKKNKSFCICLIASNAKIPNPHKAEIRSTKSEIRHEVKLALNKSKIQMFECSKHGIYMR